MPGLNFNGPKLMRTSSLVLVAVLMLGLGGCSSGKQYYYEPSNETPQGPGLFSGKDGFFTLYENGSAEDQEQHLEDAVDTSR